MCSATAGLRAKKSAGSATWRNVAGVSVQGVTVATAGGQLQSTRVAGRISLGARPISDGDLVRAIQQALSQGATPQQAHAAASRWVSQRMGGQRAPATRPQAPTMDVHSPIDFDPVTMRRGAQTPIPTAYGPNDMPRPSAIPQPRGQQTPMPGAGSGQDYVGMRGQQMGANGRPVPQAQPSPFELDFDHTSPFGKLGLDKRAEDIILKDGTNLGDHRALGEKLASRLYDAARGTRSSELLHNAMIDAMQKFAAQDSDGSHTTQRSATGESKGLSFAHRPDHYMQGQDAWESVTQ